MASSSSEQGSSSPENDAGRSPVHFDTPAGTTRITASSWAEWGVDRPKYTSVTISPSQARPRRSSAGGGLAVLRAGGGDHPKLGDDDRESVFCGCASLAAVTIPSSVTVIESEAFARCASLAAAVAIPISATAIESNAVSFCRPLVEVASPEVSVAELAVNAFSTYPALRTADYGRAAGLAASNRFPYLNRPPGPRRWSTRSRPATAAWPGAPGRPAPPSCQRKMSTVLRPAPGPSPGR